MSTTPLAVYTEFQRRLAIQDFGRMDDVVDLEGYWRIHQQLVTR